jgi:hypothetical protein
VLCSSRARSKEKYTSRGVQSNWLSRKSWDLPRTSRFECVDFVNEALEFHLFKKINYYPTIRSYNRIIIKIIAVYLKDPLRTLFHLQLRK